VVPLDKLRRVPQTIECPHCQKLARTRVLMEGEEKQKYVPPRPQGEAGGSCSQNSEATNVGLASGFGAPFWVFSYLDATSPRSCVGSRRRCGTAASATSRWRGARRMGRFRSWGPRASKTLGSILMYPVFQYATDLFS
jgi:hypothetical protein